MTIDLPAFEATEQDTVVVVHHYNEYDIVTVTTRLEVDGAPAVTELSEKLRVVPDADNQYHLVLNVPEQQVVKGSPWVVTVLLPPDCNYAGNDGDVRPPPSDGARPVVSWQGAQDPVLDVVWQYLSGR